MAYGLPEDWNVDPRLYSSATPYQMSKSPRQQPGLWDLTKKSMVDAVEALNPGINFGGYAASDDEYRKAGFRKTALGDWEHPSGKTYSELMLPKSSQKVASNSGFSLFPQAQASELPPGYVPPRVQMPSPGEAPQATQPPQAPQTAGPSAALPPGIQKASVTSSLAMRGGASPMSPESELEVAYRDMIKRQQDDVQARRDEMEKLGEKPQGLLNMDLTNLAGAIDAMTGRTRLAQSYKAPTAASEWEAKRALLQKAIGEGQDKLTDNQLGLIKAKLEQQKNAENMMLRQMLMMQRASSTDNKDDRLVNNVYDKFDNDTLIKKYGQQKAGILRASHTLDNPPDGKVTTQLLKEVSNDIAQSLAMGAGNAESDREAQEYKNLATQWAKTMSYISNQPAGVAAPELISYLRQNLQRLDEGFGQNISIRAKEIGEGRKYHSKAANEAISSKISQYSKGSQAANNLSPEDQATLEWAKANPNNPTAKQFLQKYGSM